MRKRSLSVNLAAFEMVEVSLTQCMAEKNFQRSKPSDLRSTFVATLIIRYGDLDCLGSIQDKITVCATDESYQKAKQSMALVEEETRSRGAIVIKPGGRYVGKTVKMRKPAPGVSDTVPSRIRPTPVNLASAIKKGNSAVSQRPFKDRVMHLLALKPYKKPELLLRLQKDGLSLQDKDSLDSLLQQVANMNAKDSTCTLKDYLYKEVQKDWPGYSEGDQQLLKRILFRKLCPPQNPSCVPENSAPSPPRDTANVSSSPPQKRPQPLDFIDPLTNKKPRISHCAQRTQPTFNGKLSSANGKETPLPTMVAADSVSSSSLLPTLELPRPHDPLADVSNDLNHNGKDFEMAEPAERRTASRFKQDVQQLQCPIFYIREARLLAQRQSYKNDFNAEYGEYRDLHARIERITRRFMQLDSELKQLSQGSEQYKIIHDQILQEYRKIKKNS
ncbi:hypothetical protein Chor_017143 [Crotalus horridus]